MSDVTPPEGLPDQPPVTPPPVPAASSQPPPPPPPPGYGAPPPTPAEQPFDVGAAFSWGWKKFQENFGPILIAMLVYLVIIVVVQVVAYALLAGALISSPSMEINQTTGELTMTGGSGIFAGLFVTALSVAISTVLYAFLQAAIVRGGLMIADGQKLEVGHMFKFENFGTVFVAALIVSGLTLVGILACYVGAIVVAFFTTFYMFFVVDKQAGAWESVVASFNLVKNNFGAVVLLILCVFLAYLVGALLCGIGLLVTVPVAFLALTFGFRRLQGGAVAA